MEKTIFQILDAISQDVEPGEETETTREIIPRNTGALTDDEDDEIRPVKRKKNTGTTEEIPSDPAALRMNIYLFGKTAEGATLRACVEGFKPFFFVGLPDGSKRTRDAFVSRVTDTLKYGKKWLLKVLEIDYTERRVLYGYTANRTFPFAKLSVPSMKAFRDLRRVFMDTDTSKPKFQIFAGQDPCAVYEANLDPMLRFFHLRNIKPCGWVEVAATPEDGALDADWEDIGPAEGPIATAPFLMAAWDIECYSANGEFPLAKKGYDRLAKQLYAKAENAQEAANLIIDSAIYTESPPKDMDPLYCRDKLRGCGASPGEKGGSQHFVA